MSGRAFGNSFGRPKEYSAKRQTGHGGDGWEVLGGISDMEVAPEMVI